MSNLLTDEPAFINVGLSSFADAMRATGATVDHLTWSPPGGDVQVARALAGLVGDPTVRTANEVAMARILGAQPRLHTVAPAAEVIPGLGERTLLHAGPPIAWDDMPGPVRGALVGAALFEGWVSSPTDAEMLLASGEVTFAPCHSVGAVGPMAGVISPSMPVWVVKNAEGGNASFSNLNEGLGRVLRFGANDEGVLQRLLWMRDELGPALREVLESTGPVELKPLVARALHMGDEVHNRNTAASSLFFRILALPALRVLGAERAEKMLAFVDANEHFFLNLSMAMAKNMLDAGHGIPGSSVVTAMARNGVNFGIRLSGTGDTWFQAPAPTVDGLFFASYSVADAAPDLGDSAITETAGLGGFAMAASPAIVRFVGGTPGDALAHSRRMQHITLASNAAFSLPPLGFAGTATGIDALRVVDTGILPVVNTGIAHREPGIGQVGAGITYAPRAVFDAAVVALAQHRQETS